MNRETSEESVRSRKGWVTRRRRQAIAEKMVVKRPMKSVVAVPMPIERENREFKPYSVGTVPYGDYTNYPPDGMAERAAENFHLTHSDHRTILRLGHAMRHELESGEIEAGIVMLDGLLELLEGEK